MPVIISSWIGRRFYLLMSLLAAAVVLIGFGQRFEARMLHPTHPVPPIIWVHTVVFSLWVALVVGQTTLVQAGNKVLHRRLGLASVAFAIVLTVVGVWVAIDSGRRAYTPGSTGPASFLAIPFSNMLVFAAFFGAGVAWRRQPEYHKRLMLLAALSLLVAAFARFPRWIVPAGRFNLAADAFIALALLRDWFVDRRIHRAYLVGFPALITIQLFIEWLRATPWWIDLANEILR